MTQYGVYAQPYSVPEGKAAIVSVYEPLVGSGPGQKPREELVQQSVPYGLPFGMFEYPSDAYPVGFDIDNWYPTPEELTAGFGTQPITQPEPPPGGYVPEPE